MRNYYHKIYQGILIVSLITIVASCHTSDSDKNRNPTAPEKEFLRAKFTHKGLTDGFGVYNGDGFFQIQVPAGEYLVTYATDYGAFYLVFRATQTDKLLIGLQPGDTVHEALVYSGTVTDTSNPKHQGGITIFSEFGATGAWGHLFVKDASASGIPMIGGVGVRYVPGEMFELYLPSAGVYALTYITGFGTFQLEVRAQENNFVQQIMLQPGDEVREAYILEK